MKIFLAKGPRAVAGITVAFALLVCPAPARGQLTVLMSGGFAAAYRQLLPEFERSSGISGSRRETTHVRTARQLTIAADTGI